MVVLPRAAGPAGCVHGSEDDQHEADGGPTQVAGHHAAGDVDAETLGDEDQAHERDNDRHHVARPSLIHLGARMRP